VKADGQPANQSYKVGNSHFPVHIESVLPTFKESTEAINLVKLEWFGKHNMRSVLSLSKSRECFFSIDVGEINWNDTGI